MNLFDIYIRKAKSLYTAAPAIREYKNDVKHIDDKLKSGFRESITAISENSTHTLTTKSNEIYGILMKNGIKSPEVAEKLMKAFGISNDVISKVVDMLNYKFTQE